jgi:hypothetical protein
MQQVYFSVLQNSEFIGRFVGTGAVVSFIFVQEKKNIPIFVFAKILYRVFVPP